ncbi:hypothetical protein [Paenibacillus aceris]|uniref:Sporulation histidine kinase inhibitor Sda n=1 Tax=Paenibacillus aceris TaxID=869555 RepID=A0ABS4I752_9BACL|nr:hypothetical protein [Paenibacillus aceris]MBP1966757.1 hypothetical protein [Paenibacillus aceris]NHW39384.1 hypothetical protein [Paenibacillus aceris]
MILFDLHAHLDLHLEELAFRVMGKYDSDQLRFVTSFLQDLMQNGLANQEQLLEQEPMQGQE